MGMRGGRDVQEGGLQEYMCTYGWCTLLYGRKQHNIVKQLPSHSKVTEQLNSNNEEQSKALFGDDIVICVMSSQEPNKEPTGL